MTACPGLAVFVIDETYSEDKTVVRIPYEFLPLPQVGDTVDAVDRDGQVVGKAQVVKVQKFPNKTSIVSIGGGQQPGTDCPRHEACGYRGQRGILRSPVQRLPGRASSPLRGHLYGRAAENHRRRQLDPQ